MDSTFVSLLKESKDLLIEQIRVLSPQLWETVQTKIVLNAKIDIFVYLAFALIFIAYSIMLFVWRYRYYKKESHGWLGVNNIDDNKVSKAYTPGILAIIVFGFYLFFMICAAQSVFFGNLKIILSPDFYTLQEILKLKSF